MDKTELFERAPIHKAVINMAVPTILSMIVIILYNMADTFFVGQTGNSLYISAVSLASPVFLIFTAFTSILGVGASSVISRSLGMGDREKAKQVSAFVCYAALVAGVLMSAAVLLGMEPLLAFLGTDAETHDFVKEYLGWIALGATFSIFGGTFSNVIRSEGASGDAMIGYNYGSGNKKRLMDIFKFASIASVILGAVLTAVMVVLRTPIIQAFIDDQEVVAYGTRMLVALQMAGPILGLVFIGANTIQAMGKAFAAFILNLLRQGIFLIPLIFLLDHFFGLNGVVYSNAVADYLAVVVSYIVCIAYMKKMAEPDSSG